MAVTDERRTGAAREVIAMDNGESAVIDDAGEAVLQD
jgi:hypothetical protein